MVEHRSPKPLMRVRFLQPLPVDYESWKQDFFLFLKEVELPPLFSLFTSQFSHTLVRRLFSLKSFTISINQFIIISFILSILSFTKFQRFLTQQINKSITNIFIIFKKTGALLFYHEVMNTRLFI